MERTISNLSRELNIPEENILSIYKSYWKFIKAKIEELPLKEDLREEDFNKLKTNFNIPNLGKLHCTYNRYKSIKTIRRSKND